MGTALSSNTSTITEEEARSRVKALDLSDVILKVCLPVSKRGLGWTEEKARRVSNEYRGFLFVCWKYPQEQIPTLEIDEFWHTHIIFTEKYAADCNSIFGTYLHHKPDFKQNLVEPDWWKTAFDTKYVPKYAAYNLNTGGTISSFLESVLPVGSVLDIGCGTGRISHRLHEKGYTVTGVDYSEEMVAVAQTGAGTYIKADMRDFSLGTKFDSAISVFSSFGYFDDKEDDARTLQCIRNHLVDGGTFVLDLKPRQSDEEWKIIKHDDFIGRYRQYSQEEITELLTKNGFVVEDIKGNYDGTPFTNSSPRMILICKKH